LKGVKILSKINCEAKLKKCTSCNLTFEDDRNFCNECGTELTAFTDQNAENKRDTGSPPTVENSAPPVTPTKTKKGIVKIPVVIALTIIVLALFVLSGIIHVHRLPPAFPLLAILIAGIVLYFLYRKNKGDKNEKM